MFAADGHDVPGPLEQPALPGTRPDFVGHIVQQLFSIGLIMESARSIVAKGPAGDRIAAATSELDKLIRDIRTTQFGRDTAPTAVLNERMADAARALQAGALDAAGLLEGKVDPARPPTRMDYPAEIKRWQAFAQRAGQMAKRLERSPWPDAAAPADVD